jgi:hypothetical protein
MLHRFMMTWPVLAGALTAHAADEPQRPLTAEQARVVHEQEVVAAVAELKVTLNRLKEAYRSQLQAIRAAAQSAGNSAEVQRVEELLKPDLPVVRLESRRWLWKSQDGFFEQLHEGHWVEKVPNGDANLFDESIRTDSYVELSNRGAIVRLYEDHCDVRLLPAREFKTFYRGSWKLD